MNFLLQIKRRLFGQAGAPNVLSGGELAYNEVDNNLYYGSNNGILKIAGKGNLVDRSDTYQNIIGDKIFNNTTRFSSVCAFTPAKENFDNQIATTYYTKQFFKVIDGGTFDTPPENYLTRYYFYPQINSDWFNLDNWFSDYRHIQHSNLLPTSKNNVTVIGGVTINVNADYFSWRSPATINVGSTSTIAFSSTNSTNISSNIIGNAIFNGNVTYKA
jgi:hypothetical protein